MAAEWCRAEAMSAVGELLQGREPSLRTLHADAAHCMRAASHEGRAFSRQREGPTL